MAGHSASKCSICGDDLHPLSKSYFCSDKCRQRKSRLKRGYARLIYLTKENLVRVMLAVDNDLVDMYEITRLYNILFEQVNLLREKIIVKDKSNEPID